MGFKKILKYMIPQKTRQRLRKMEFEVKRQIIDIKHTVKNHNKKTYDHWLDHFNKLIFRDIESHIPTTCSNGTAIIWEPQSNSNLFFFQLLIAKSLQLRGWKVLVAKCDLELPHCVYESVKNEGTRNCSICREQSSKILQKFSLPAINLSDYLTQADVNQIYKEVKGQEFNELIEEKVGNYEIGKASFEQLFWYYFGLISELNNDKVPTFKRIFAGNRIAYFLAKKINNDYLPQIVIMHNGKILHSEAGFKVFTENNVRCITWEDYPPYNDSFIFSGKQPAVLGYIDDSVWDKEKHLPLKKDERDSVEGFLVNWQKGNISDINYHPNPVKEMSELYGELKIAPNKRTFVAFTNVVWDSACLGRNIGFSSIVQWVYDLIDWFTENQDQQLIIRIHPAEKRLDKAAETIYGFAEAISAQYPDLANNIIIIGPEDDTFSYTLAEMADAIGVYTTSLAYELAATGRKVWVAGDVHYRGKGFTLDLKNKEHLYDLLRQKEWVNTLTEEEINIAKKYIYLRTFKQVVRIPYMARQGIRYLNKPFFKNLKFIYPDKDPLFNSLIERIIDGGHFMEIPQKTNAKWKEIKLV